jgi:hypothetical protein
MDWHGKGCSRSGVIVENGDHSGVSDRRNQATAESA